MNPTDPNLRDSVIWNVIERAIQLLEKKHDLALISDKDEIIGVIASAVSNTTIDSLTDDEKSGLIQALNYTCYGPNPIEDWECHSITGLTKNELNDLLNKLNGN